MELNVLTLCYLIASVTFILGLKMLSSPASARKGNLVAAAGMVIAILATIFLYEDNGEKLHNYTWIFAGLLIGTVAGTLSAKKVKMTAMPEMVLATVPAANSVARMLTCETAGPEVCALGKPPEKNFVNWDKNTFARLIAAKDDRDVLAAEQAFRGDVLKHIKDIADRKSVV